MNIWLAILRAKFNAKVLVKPYLWSGPWVGSQGPRGQQEEQGRGRNTGTSHKLNSATNAVKLQYEFYMGHTMPLSQSSRVMGEMASFYKVLRGPRLLRSCDTQISNIWSQRYCKEERRYLKLHVSPESWNKPAREQASGLWNFSSHLVG